jgi:hypothetical protein
MYYKVKITDTPDESLPEAKTGQQVDGALSVVPTAMGGNDIDQYIGKPQTQVKKTLGPVPRDKANLEAEKGETAYGDINGDGFTEHYKIGGKRHHQGGTPLDLPDDTFIFSDTSSMKIKDPAVLAKFGKDTKTKSYTPAELAKQYDINKYRKLLQDPDSDAIDKKTAELMIRNYNMKLGALALAQESKKGFPQGIPKVSEPYLESNGIAQEQILPTYQPKTAPQEEQIEDVSYEDVPAEMPSGEQMATPDMFAKYGLSTNSPFDYNRGLRKAQTGDTGNKLVPYSESEAYTPTGVRRLNQFREQYGLPPISESSNKSAIKTASGELQSKIIDTNPELVVDFMTNKSHKPNNKLSYTLTQKGYAPTNEGVRKAVEDGAITKDEIKRDYKDELWWYRAVRTEKRGDLSKEDYEQRIKQPGAIEQNGVYYFSDPAEPDLYYYYDPQTGEPKQADAVTNETVKKKADAQRPDIEPIDFGQPPRVVTPEWTTPDKLNYYGALADKYSVNKYFPWAPMVDLEEPTPTFLDPTRELAAQSEQANIITQGLGQFVGPQALSARASSIQGQGAKQAADTLGRYNNANIGIANQFEQMQTNIRNQERLQNQGIAKQLYDQNVITNQEFDNAMRMGNQNKRAAFATGWKNASDIAMLNATSPQYDIDPRTGTVVFRGGKAPSPTRATTFDYYFRQYRQQGLEPKDAIQAAKLAMSDGNDPYAMMREGGMFVLGSNVYPPTFY